MAISKLASVLVGTTHGSGRRFPYVLGAAAAVGGGGALVAATGCLDSVRAPTIVNTRSEGLGFRSRSGSRDDDEDAAAKALVFPSLLSAASLVVPTMEASLRAARLVGTAARIVWDYKVALPSSSSSSSLSSSSWFGQQQQQQQQSLEEIELQQLEERIERLEGQLERAQIDYARGTSKSKNHPNHPNHPNLTVEERITLQHEQKTRMRDSAKELASAEEEWRTMQHLSSKSRLHRASAERLLQLCRDNGGVYIKVGQHLANLDYIVPREYIEVLSSLFDDAPSSHATDVYTVIEEDLGTPVHKIFERFDPVPIASASLAQVHVAYSKTDPTKKLAVKVQHRGLRETSAGDLFALTRVVRFIDAWCKDFEFGWIANEMAPQLPKELDFRREGRNSEQAARQLAHSGLACCIPRVLWEHTSPRVLTMEFEEGFRATDKASLETEGLSKRDVAKLISSVFNSQVFLSGFVHCDPHPGNCLIRKSKTNGKPEMVLVDHGLYKTLDTDFRVNYAELWRSLMMADLKGIKDACHGLGVTNMYPLFAAMLTSRPYDEIIERSQKGSFSSMSSMSSSGEGRNADRAVIAGYAKQFLGDIVSLLGVLPPQMLLLLKMNDCLRHIDMALDSPANTLVIAGKYASRAVYKHQLDESARDFMYGAASLTTTARHRFRHWWEYVKVLFRIKVHDIVVGAWALSRHGNY